jgi:hypothetical protein
VRAQPFEHPLAVADVDAELDLWVPGGEGLHELRSDVLAGGGDGADPQLGGRGVRGLARGARALVEQADHVRRVGGERLARRARAHAAPDPLGQLDAKLARQRGHGGRHRRLRHDELLGGRGHRTGAHDGQEAAQLGDRYSHC